jgi:hypothetical protein
MSYGANPNLVAHGPSVEANSMSEYSQADSSKGHLFSVICHERGYECSFGTTDDFQENIKKS